MRWLKWLAPFPLALVALAVGAAGWLLGTESGLRWALGFAPPEIALEEPRGALARTVSFERIAFEGSEARKVSFQVDLLELLAGTVSVESLRVESLKLQRPKESGKETGALPVRIRVSDAQLKSLEFEGYELYDLNGDYSGSASGHEAQASFSAAGARASVKASLKDQISVAAELRSLNLAVIDPSLPQTALQATLSGKGTSSAFAGTATLTNPDPGPVDRERLPFSRIEAAFSTDFKQLTLQR